MVVWHFHRPFTSVCSTQFNAPAELPRDLHGSTVHQAGASGSWHQNGRGGVLRQLGVSVRDRPLSDRVLAHVAVPRATAPATAPPSSPAAAARAAPAAAAPPSSGLLRDRDGPDPDHGCPLAGQPSPRLAVRRGGQRPYGVRPAAEHRGRRYPRRTDRHLPYRWQRGRGDDSFTEGVSAHAEVRVCEVNT